MIPLVDKPSLFRRYGYPESRGINLVDLMMWVIVSSLLMAVTFQSIEDYRRGAIVYQMKSDIDGVVDISGAMGTRTGDIGDDELGRAVAESKKSKGVSIEWGKVQLNSDAAAPMLNNPVAAAPTLQIERVAYTTSAVQFTAGSALMIPLSTLDDPSYVLVASHEDAPDIKVVYFFEDAGTYTGGEHVVIPDEGMPDIEGGTYIPDPNEEEETPSPEPTDTGTATPEPEPTESSSPEESVEPSPEETENNTPEPDPSTPVESTEPPVETTPAPEPTETETSESPVPEPEPTESTPEQTEEPEPEVPLPPSQNLIEGTKKFPLCHGKSMNSIELPFNGLLNGHHGGTGSHEYDIIPPIPVLGYEGWNWTVETAAIFYNDCNPVN